MWQKIGETGSGEFKVWIGGDKCLFEMYTSCGFEPVSPTGNKSGKCDATKAIEPEFEYIQVEAIKK